MSEIVHINEIKCLKIHARNENEKVNISTEEYTLVLPHLHKDFRNKEDNYVAVSCFPPFPYSDEVENKFCDYITQTIKNSETIIIFDNVYEGNTISCINGIYKIIDRLNLNPRNCYFISGGMQAKKFHEEYCQERSITNLINIIIINAWERHIQLTMMRWKLIDKFTFDIRNRDKNFLCFNRVLRPQRIALLGLLYEKNLVDSSYYSFFYDLTHTGKSDPGSWLKGNVSDNVYDIVCANLEKNREKFPLIINNDDGSNTNAIYESDIDYYKNSYFSLVTETFFFSKNNGQRWEERSVFFSEKIFKPIACNHPFILVSKARSLYFLRKLGYKTFHPYIDESYDLIEDDELRLLAIVDEIERLSKQTPEQWLEWLTNIKDIAEHNKNTLLSKSRDDFIFLES